MCATRSIGENSEKGKRKKDKVRRMKDEKGRGRRDGGGPGGGRLGGVVEDEGEVGVGRWGEGGIVDDDEVFVVGVGGVAGPVVGAEDGGGVAAVDVEDGQFEVALIVEDVVGAFALAAHGDVAIAHGDEPPGGVLFLADVMGHFLPSDVLEGRGDVFATGIGFGHQYPSLTSFVQAV